MQSERDGLRRGAEHGAVCSRSKQPLGGAGVCVCVLGGPQGEKKGLASVKGLCVLPTHYFIDVRLT